MFKTMTSALDPKKRPSDEEVSKIPSYIFCRWLSGNPSTILAANTINQLFDIPVENQYWMIKAAFSGKIRFIPYPSQAKMDTEKSIENVSDYFKVSPEKAREYVDLISPDEMEFIQSLYV